MAFKKTGYNGWIQYDDQTDTIKYGDWTFNPQYLGLERSSQSFDPSSFKSMNDVYKALGATDKQLQQSRYGMMAWGNNNQIFSGADSWKNDVAQQMWDLVNPDKGKSLWGGYSGQSNRNTGLNWFGMNRREDYTNSVYKGQDGLIYLDRKQNIPMDQAFAQKAYDKTWELYNAGVDQRHGQNPYGNEDKMHGKATKTSLLA